MISKTSRIRRKWWVLRYRLKIDFRRTLRKLKLMKPYEPKDMFGRPYPLEHALSCVGKGWWKLVYECYQVCVEYETDIHQIKEKFGGMRFYVGGSTHKALELIDNICDRADKICENCGRAGKLDTSGYWYKTLCPDCTKVEQQTPSRELEHLMSPEAWEDWKARVESGEVARVVMNFISKLTDALGEENSE